MKRPGDVCYAPPGIGNTARALCVIGAIVSVVCLCISLGLTAKHSYLLGAARIVVFLLGIAVVLVRA